MKLMTFVLVLLTAMLLISCVNYDFSKDKDECQEQLVTMSSCLNYVTGEVKSPSPQCCTILYTKLNVTKKCLCILVMDRNQPSLGLKLNATLALNLPSLCHAPNNPRDCLGLLHLDTKSPEAQVFIQAANTTQGSEGDGWMSPITNGTKPKFWHKTIIIDVLFILLLSIFLLKLVDD